MGLREIMIRRSLLGVFAASLACVSQWTPAKAETYEWKQWSYACMHDHKDRYGTLMNPANCWAMVCKNVVNLDPSSFEVCLRVYFFDRDGIGLAREEADELCQPAPSQIAVDGRRIDLLSDEEQVEAVRKGRKILRRVEVRGWPYCRDADIEADLTGSEEIYQRLRKMSPQYLGY